MPVPGQGFRASKVSGASRASRASGSWSRLPGVPVPGPGFQGFKNLHGLWVLCLVGTSVTLSTCLTLYIFGTFYLHFQELPRTHFCFQITFSVGACFAHRIFSHLFTFFLQRVQTHFNRILPMENVMFVKSHFYHILLHFITCH